MKRCAGLACGVLLLLLASYFYSGLTLSGSLVEIKTEKPSFTSTRTLEVAGRTQCPPGRKAMIAPVPLHPVEEVYVAPGDFVKKGARLVRLDDDEPKADVRAKEAHLHGAQIVARETRRHKETMEKSFWDGALSLKNYHDAQATAHKAEKDEQAAKASLESAQAELEHYLVVAAIDGIISWLDVYPGMVSRPGTTLWGEILDLREIDVRCELTPEQADGVQKGQAADIDAKNGKRIANGKIVHVGIAADRQTGLVPVTVRMLNSDGRLRAEVPVRVRFIEAVLPDSAK